MARIDMNNLRTANAAAAIAIAMAGKEKRLLPDTFWSTRSRVG